MAGEEREGARRWAATIAGLLVTLPVVYVLSIGPVAGWAARQRQSDAGLSDERIESLESFYSPLLFMHAHYGSIRNTLNWYMDLWM